MTRDERRAVGHRIRVVRERQGWDRGELARRLGVHAGSVARWESGGAVPHGYTLARIAQVGGTTAQWLHTGHDHAPPAPEAVADAAPREPPADPFASYEVVTGFLAGIAPPGHETLRKLDALEGLRRMLTARGALPGWWYGVLERVEAGAL
ncbi:MAG TPA: helix-turn-helix transcriptional regulator [Longimicrobium sp.]|nr:helix-turn-helix transcriptional regulator [Longimicrobium sp.]